MDRDLDLSVDAGIRRGLFPEDPAQVAMNRHLNDANADTVRVLSGEWVTTSRHVPPRPSANSCGGFALPSMQHASSEVRCTVHR